MSARDLSPRSVETLPVTLQPNAVLLAAPGSDRMKSLLVACAVYCALGAVVLGGARKVTRPPLVVGTFQFEHEYELEEPVPVARVVPPPPSGGTVQPAGFTPLEPVRNPNVVPDYTPTSLNLTDHSKEVAASTSQPGVLTVQGASELSSPVPPPRSSAPVFIETQEIRVLHTVQPTYPALARLIRAQGPVELQMTIDAGGVPTNVAVVSGPHPLLINEAVRVARLWRFQPATVDGAPVAATFRLTVSFRLER